MHLESQRKGHKGKKYKKVAHRPDFDATKKRGARATDVVTWIRQALCSPRVAFFGGSFDPPHRAISRSRAQQAAFRLDWVLLRRSRSR